MYDEVTSQESHIKFIRKSDELFVAVKSSAFFGMLFRVNHKLTVFSGL